MSNLGNEKRNPDTIVWLTPPQILKKLGPFDLDPCAATNRPWDTAKVHYTKEDDGLVQPWHGRVWMNPPYGKGIENWLQKLSEHPDGGIALIFARTETKAFFDWIWGKADGLLFIKGRLSFYNEKGESSKAPSGAPSVLVAYTKKEAEVLKTCGIEGKYVEL